MNNLATSFLFMLIYYLDLKVEQTVSSAFTAVMPAPSDERVTLAPELFSRVYRVISPYSDGTIFLLIFM